MRLPPAVPAVGDRGREARRVKDMDDKNDNKDRGREAVNFYELAPSGYSLCLRPECASARSCLRHLAGSGLTTRYRVTTVVNPLLASPEGEGKCPFFRPGGKVRVAYGFTKAMALVPHGNARAVRYALQARMCERDFYYLRRGDKPIYPEAQRWIAAELARAGAPEPIEFDRYEWRYDWREGDYQGP